MRRWTQLLCGGFALRHVTLVGEIEAIILSKKTPKEGEGKLPTVAEGVLREDLVKQLIPVWGDDIEKKSEFQQIVNRFVCVHDRYFPQKWEDIMKNVKEQLPPEGCVESTFERIVLSVAPNYDLKSAAHPLTIANWVKKNFRGFFDVFVVSDGETNIFRPAARMGDFAADLTYAFNALQRRSLTSPVEFSQLLPLLRSSPQKYGAQSWTDLLRNVSGSFEASGRLMVREKRCPKALVFVDTTNLTAEAIQEALAQIGDRDEQEVQIVQRTNFWKEDDAVGATDTDIVVGSPLDPRNAICAKFFGIQRECDALGAFNVFVVCEPQLVEWYAQELPRGELAAEAAQSGEEDGHKLQVSIVSVSRTIKLN